MYPPYRLIQGKDEKTPRNVPGYLIAGIISILVIAGAGSVSAQGSGVVEGRVQNGTAGADAESVADLTVTLIMIEPGGTTKNLAMTTDNAGRFSFSGLDNNTQITYQAQVEYQSVVYASEAKSFAESESTINLVLIIYETIAEDPGLTVPGHSILLEFESGALTVLELLRLQNPSDRTYIGDEQRRTISLPIPSQATDISFQNQELENRVVFTEDGLALTQPLLPGETPILLSYSLPLAGATFDFSKSLAYPTASFNVLIEDVGATLVAPGFTFIERLENEGKQYLHYAAQDLTRGEQIEFRLSQIPDSNSNPENALFPSWAILGLVSLGIAGALAWAIIRKPKTPALSKAALIQAVSDLDNDFAAGKVPEEDYKRRREEMKEELMRIWPRGRQGE